MLLTLGIILATVAVLATLFIWFTRRIWFFRDPDHGNTEQDDKAIYSPVYGIVSYVKKVENGEVVCEKKGEAIRVSEITKDDWPSGSDEPNGWLIGIAMTALDVHFQYSPIPGTLVSVVHKTHGRNLPMFDLWEYIRITWLRRGIQLFARRYVLENERQTMWIHGKHFRLALVLIADKFVSKIQTFARTGSTVSAGQKLSFIGRGSQVDVVVCGHPDLRIWVKEGDPVKGPRTLLAREL